MVHLGNREAECAGSVASVYGKGAKSWREMEKGEVWDGRLGPNFRSTPIQASAILTYAGYSGAGGTEDSHRGVNIYIYLLRFGGMGSIAVLGSQYGNSY